MHVLAVNSVFTLLNYLTDQLKQTPPNEEINSYKIIVGAMTRNEDYEDLARPEEPAKPVNNKTLSVNDYQIMPFLKLFHF